MAFQDLVGGMAANIAQGLGCSISWRRRTPTSWDSTLGKQNAISVTTAIQAVRGASRVTVQNDHTKLEEVEFVVALGQAGMGSNVPDSHDQIVDGSVTRTIASVEPLAAGTMVRLRTQMISPR